MSLSAWNSHAPLSELFFFFFFFLIFHRGLYRIQMELPNLHNTIDNLHISHNASGMGANIRVLLIRNSSSHSSLDVNGLELPCLAHIAAQCVLRDYVTIGNSLMRS